MKQQRQSTDDDTLGENACNHVTDKTLISLIFKDFLQVPTN